MTPAATTPLARVIGALPADGLAWCVGFRLTPLRRIAEPATIAAMFHLDAPPPDGCEAIILMDRVRLLVDPHGNTEPPLSATPAANTVASVYATELAGAGWDQADVIGFGRTHDGGRVTMAGRFVDNDRLEATAILPAAPATEALMPLLAGVGVTYLGGQQTETGFSARFVNRLSRHLEAGRAASFMRTALCNDWFLSGCVMQPEQAASLVQAARDRIAITAEAVLSQATALAAQLRTMPPLCMTCLPPPPAAPFPYGDLVPLGLLRFGLRAWIAQDRRALAAAQLTRKHLLARRQGALWSFETGGLPTAADTALVLLGLPDPDAIAALAVFRTPDGRAIVPQHCGPAAPGVMEPDETNRHWCHPDYATTALTCALQRPERLDTLPMDWLVQHFDDRHGLFIANPFLVDLALALAIRTGDANPLPARLTAEILAARNPDGSFGRYDKPLSTACAITALGALGTAPGAVHRGQLALADMGLDEPVWPEATPFYSTLLEDRHDGRGPRHRITLYADTFRMITLGMILQAFAQPGDPFGEAADPARREPAQPHPRYRCEHASAYVAHHVVPLVDRTAGPCASAR